MILFNKNFLEKLISYWKRYKPIILLSLIGLTVIALVLFKLKISDTDTFYATALGAFLGFCGAGILTRISLYGENRTKDIQNKENTRYVYELYKDELEMNKQHLHDMCQPGHVAFFRMKSITRDKLWGELANYSKDINLMKKLNWLYGEFELINNKVELANIARMANIEKDRHEKSNDLGEEIARQVNGIIELGEKARPVLDEVLESIEEKIKSAC